MRTGGTGRSTTTASRSAASMRMPAQARPLICAGSGIRVGSQLRGGLLQRLNHSVLASGLRLSGRKALSYVGGGAAGLLWPVPLQRVQGTICGGSGSAERMRIVPRPRQVGHWEGMGLRGCVVLTAPHVVAPGALSTCRVGRRIRLPALAALFEPGYGFAFPPRCFRLHRALHAVIRDRLPSGPEWVHEISTTAIRDGAPDELVFGC